MFLNVGAFTDHIDLRGEIFRHGKFGNVIDPKVFHKLLGCTVEHWPANSVGFTNDFYQTLIQQFLNGVITVYATNIFNLRLRHRLFIRNN